jgi:FkbM family methyltransferase
MIPSTRHEIEALPFEGAVSGEQLTRVPCLGGAFDLFLYSHDKSLTSAIASTGYWESWVTAWHVQNVSEGDIYIDLGANAGYFSFLAESLGATAMAFEANPRYCTLMNQSSAFNGTNLHVYNWAVSDEEGSVKLNFYGDHDGSASIVGPGWDGKSMDVKACRLDSWRFPAGKMIVKMDIEGAEEKAWDGMTDLLKNRKPIIILEYTPGAYSDEFWDKLTEYGKVSKLSFDTYEEITSRKHVESLDDWCTLVVRAW